MSHFDTIVLGGGTMGTAAAWELAKRGDRTLVLEQFEHVHTLGSHSGYTRIIRHAYSEGADYVPLVLRADQLWMELEADIGETVYHRVGGLELTAPGYTQAHTARDSARIHNLDYEWLTGAEVRERWPVLQVPDDWVAGYGARSGFLDVEMALHGLGDQARVLGAKIRQNEPVRSWAVDGEGVRVTTDQGTYTADRLIITAGAWAGQVLAEIGLPLEVRRKVLFWLEVSDEAPFQPDDLPVFITESGYGEIYGFPIWGRRGLKIARHDGGTAADPDALDRTVGANEADEVLALARALFPGVTGRVLESAVCMYTMTPDGHFIVDRHPLYPQVTVGAGFSGHGFKFATAIGEHLVDLSQDPFMKPLDILRLDRFAGRD
jgi:monomeric sarcosine oxidase